jgi:hypothetical protein
MTEHHATVNFKPPYAAGGIAALIFRRNIGAEVSLFTGSDP